MMRIKIKSFRDAKNRLHAATNKFFFRDGTALRISASRALEPEEVIELPDEEAIKLLSEWGRYLEQTHEKPTRPICFRDAAEAQETSSFKPLAEGRAEAKREEMEEVKAEMEERAQKAAEAEREKIREEEREKIRAEIRAEEEAKLRGEVVEPSSEGGAGPEGEPSGHPLPAEMAQGEMPEEEEAEEPQPAARRRRRGG